MVFISTMKDISCSGIIQNGLHHGYEGHFLHGIIQNGLHLGYEGHLSLWNHSKWSSSWL
ncbi:hypothetical protein [Neobacillus rhizophilus]|uniref:Uncharacterized protein n=1 Tax=Neobacillus rhizophilus TaxID=2833579 RepID=A0A942U450_9BACI|nr:hypothetical protein [Neobacillus rhizophilus]MBS4212512.1 hypothetical protein [Neobacillus rhizophilus]